MMVVAVKRLLMNVLVLQTKRAGPWEGGPKLIEDVVNKPCPPCCMPIQVQCLGKHEVSSTVY